MSLISSAFPFFYFATFADAGMSVIVLLARAAVCFVERNYLSRTSSKAKLVLSCGMVGSQSCYCLLLGSWEIIKDALIWNDL